MKFLKWLVIVVVVVAVLLFGMSFLLPSKVHVERSIVVAAPPQEVFAQVNDLKQWPAWSPWNLRDPQMEMTYEGPASGVGAKSIWKSASEGNGSQTITASVPPSAIETLLDFGEHGTATSFWKFSGSEEGATPAPQTRVTWGLDMELESPMERLFGAFMEGMIGPDYEAGLANLKSIVEEQQQPAGEAMPPAPE